MPRDATANKVCVPRFDPGTHTSYRGPLWVIAQVVESDCE